jgi:hypothetical protein
LQYERTGIVGDPTHDVESAWRTRDNDWLTVVEKVSRRNFLDERQRFFGGIR